jgi:HECT-domain (ubiquitin-transferase)
MLDEQLDLNDLKDVDPDLHKGLIAYLQHPLADLGMDDMTFTTEVHYFGKTETRELKPGGRDVAVRLPLRPQCTLSLTM